MIATRRKKRGLQAISMRPGCNSLRMLRIVQNRSAAGAKTYYARADYYTEGQELTGHWGGKGAMRLGLEGVVEKEAFERVASAAIPRPTPLAAVLRRGRRGGAVRPEEARRAPEGGGSSRPCRRDPPPGRT